MNQKIKIILISFILIFVLCGGLLAGMTVFYFHQEALKDEVVDVKPEPIDMNPLRKLVEETVTGTYSDWSVYVKHLNSNSVLEYQNQQFQPASVIKLFRMVAFYRALQEGKITSTPDILEQVERMIIYSENAASNEVVTYIGNGDFYKGAEYVNETATLMGCTQTQDGMMLFDYDPGYLVSGMNYSSVRDCGIVLEKIYRKECVSPKYDEEMLNLLLRQTRREKIPALLPEGTKIANKTGETNDIQADVGIVFSPNGDYIICAMANHTRDSLQAHQTISVLSDLTYRFFNEKKVN